MWVFGYGSLMWDGWEDAQGCIRRTTAELRGYRRVFNKASVRNWGSHECPCPTLNLTKSESNFCAGVAFEFPDTHQQAIEKYLTEREGKDFILRKLPAKLEAGNEIEVFVSIYRGSNLVSSRNAKDLAWMVLKAEGKDGTCELYVMGIARELDRLGIDDPAVTELSNILAKSP